MHKMNDNNKMQDARERLHQALTDNDQEAYRQAFDDLQDAILEDMKGQMHQELEDMRAENDQRIRADRGEQRLTSEEMTYYQGLMQVMGSKNPQQALADLNLIMPQTVVERVFDDMATDHVLLSHVDFVNTGAATKMIYSKTGYQEAQWGELCDDVVKEIVGGFGVAETMLLKLAAFIPVCKEALELGPVWLDRYVRAIMAEAIANGLEHGIVDGTGNHQPIGMTRDVGEGVSVVGGVYPKKTAVVINDLSDRTLGNVIAYMLAGPDGAHRIGDLIMVVNMVDYYTKVMPAARIMAPDGTWRDALPYPITIIPVSGNILAQGEAVIGVGRRYFASLGNGRDGVIEYSDHAQFIQDKRVYLGKLYGNGFPKDNEAFIRLDISGLRPAYLHVINHTAPSASTDVTLSALSFGKGSLTPAFDPTEDTYTIATTLASLPVKAIANNAAATVKIVLVNTTTGVGGVEIANGARMALDTGTNTVTVTVIAESGATDDYTVTITKS